MRNAPEQQRPTYLVCGCTPWARAAFDRDLAPRNTLTARWVYLARQADLDFDILASYYPATRYIFLFHWRWRVPHPIVRDYEVVNFHLGQSGGSPLQHDIAADVRLGTLYARRATDDLDAGPGYTSCAVSLHGTAEEIYNRLMARAAETAVAMAAAAAEGRPWLAVFPPDPRPFRPRRTPADSRIPKDLRLMQVYDWLRMLDADGYPPAFLDWGGFRLSFTRAGLYTDEIRAEVSIRPRPLEAGKEQPR